jgi:hypothetical protein
LRSTALLLALSLVGLAEHAVAQQATAPAALLPAATTSVSGVSTPDASSKDELSACNRYRLQADQSLSFKQRLCFAVDPLITPQFALTAAVMTGFSELRNSEKLQGKPMSNFPMRFADYYARHSAQAAGEMMAGYLHHEDPRLRTSNQRGFLRRTGAAFSSVIIAKDSDGNSEMAFAPIAGSLSSGFVAMEVGRRDNNVAGALRRSGFVYSTYFVKALVREYKPELTEFTRHLLHRQ